MKRRFIAVLLATVLVVGSNMPVFAGQIEGDVTENGTENAAREEILMPETTEEPEKVVEAMEEEGAADNQVADAVEVQSLEESVEVAESEEVVTAETFSKVDENGLTWELTDGTLTISGNGAIEDVPSGIWDKGCTSVIIGEGITEIGNFAFYYSRGLQNVSIPGSVTKIGEAAFGGCDITSVVIPSSVTEMGASVFVGCDDLTSVVIPDSVTKIADYAFNGCSALTSINLPNSITEIGEEAFSWCTSLTGITIPDSVTEINDKAFADCEKLTEVTIPASVTKIGNGAFRGCGMSEISIPGSVTEIGHLAFYRCKNLTSVSIPRGVTRINSWTFRNCENLSDMTIPNNVTEIAYGAFAGCKKLPEVTIPKSVKSVGYAAFSGCKGLRSVTFKGDVPEISGEVSGYVLFEFVDGMYREVNDKGVEPFYNVTATACYPSGNQTYTEEIRTAYGSGLTWEEQKMPELPFTDVNQSDWYLEAAGYVFSRGIMTGMNETEFGPSVKLSRAQFATILYRMEGEPEAAYDGAAFPDVKEGQFYTAPAMWAKGSGVIKGYEDGRFGPADEITREDMALMMYRYASMLELDTTARGDLSGFPDAEKVSGYAADAMKWAVGEELIRGKEEAGKDNIIEPQGTAERAQCATIIMRFMEGYGL